MAEFLLTRAPSPPYHRFEGKTQLRLYYPGMLMVPLLLTLMLAVSMMSGWGLLPQWRVWSYWPVTLIATGLEEVYLWTRSARA